MIAKRCIDQLFEAMDPDGSREITICELIACEGEFVGVWPLFESAIVIKLVWSRIQSTFDIDCEVTARRLERHRPCCGKVWHCKVNELITMCDSYLVRVSRQVSAVVRAIGSFVI